jgi:hypothetical protein
VFVIPYRRAVSDLLKLKMTTPLYTFLPDDVAHLPCLVVGRPSIRESGTSGVMTTTLDVSLLGRRISDEDSQQELDALADQLFEALGGTRNMRSGAIQLRCTVLLPATVLVAGQEMPGYIATVSAEIVSC